MSACLGSGCSGPGETLEERIAQFWNAHLAGDRVLAQQFVTPATRNNFLGYRVRAYRSWKLAGMERVSPTEARVTIDTEGFLEQAQQVLPFQETQVWKSLDGEWFLEVPSQAEVVKGGQQALFGSRPEADGKVTVSKILRFQFFNQAQLARLQVLNGTDQPLDVDRVELDETLFKVVSIPDRIAAGERGTIDIVHTGPDVEKNQKSRIRLFLDQAGTVREYQVDVVYNYISKGLRGILGVTRAEMAALKRTDKVGPKKTLPGMDGTDKKIEEFQKKFGAPSTP